MKARTLIALALAGVASIGMAGCTFTAPVTTAEKYFPSDGYSADVDGLQVRNIMLVTDSGNHGFMVFTASNPTKSDKRLDIRVEGASAPLSFTVPAGRMLRVPADLVAQATGTAAPAITSAPTAGASATAMPMPTATQVVRPTEPGETAGPVVNAEPQATEAAATASPSPASSAYLVRGVDLVEGQTVKTTLSVGSAATEISMPVQGPDLAYLRTVFPTDPTIAPEATAEGEEGGH